MINLLEPEETIGTIWHRMVGDRSSYPQYQDAAVRFVDLAQFLPILFRTLVGRNAVKFAARTPVLQDHRLSFMQRLGMPREAIPISQASPELILLPETIDIFPERKLNKELYIWLAVFFASSTPFEKASTQDLLVKDLHFIRRSYLTTRRALRFFKGFSARYDTLASSMLLARGPRKLPVAEQEIDSLIHKLLAGKSEMPDEHPFYQYVINGHSLPANIKAPKGYCPTLSLPLWGEIAPAKPLEAYTSDEGEAGATPESGDEQLDNVIKKARRETFDEADRDDPLILYPFEGLMTWAEMLNLARSVEDDDEENAKKAAEEADEIVLTPNKKRAATKIKVELDLAAGAVSNEAISGDILYKEWDYHRKAYRDDYCNVIAREAMEEEDAVAHSKESLRMIKRVRRQFEALRPKREILHRQVDGSELDMDAVIRAQCDMKACGRGSDNIYMTTREQARDLSVAILIDCSLSTDAYIENHRVLDVEKETLAVMAHGLDACGDQFALYSFTSKRREEVYVNTLKGFEERMSEKVDRKVSAMKPGHYTRIGAALRHVSSELDTQPTRHRLLLVITDGKPNDVDHYEGRYGVEDTRMAIREARRLGQTVYGVTIDKQARDYFPYMFGKGSFSIVGHLSKLPSALPLIYRNICGL